MRYNRLAQVLGLMAVAALPLMAMLETAFGVPTAKGAGAQTTNKSAKGGAGAKKTRLSRPATMKTLAQAAPQEAPSVARARPDGPTVDPLTVAAQVDELIAAELRRTNSPVAGLCSDEDFLRRVSFDLAGVSPSPQEVTLFGIDPDSRKRAAAIDRLLAGELYPRNWARYWRDVFQSRATETRLQFLIPAFQTFESWMAGQLAAQRPWNEIATALLTATGDSRENGQTALIIAQRAEPAEVAAEMSRVFLGIQIQCANCHDHPTDSWKREQFHGLAAFFPRLQLQPKRQTKPPSLELVSFTPAAGGRGQGPGDFLRQIHEHPEQFIKRFDTNGDGKLSKEEAHRGSNNAKRFDRLFEFGDTNHDDLLTASELKSISFPQMMQTGRGTPEYLMPDLQHPQSEGKPLDPVFFLGNLNPGSGLSDGDRRQTLARYVTSTENPWFAKAFVNRIWGQLVGEGFYMPIDDIGPDRTPSYPAALDALSSGFTSSGYDIAWLFRAITNTQTYQRQIRPRDLSQATAAFAAAAPIRLRADQLYDALSRALGIKEEAEKPSTGPGMMGIYRNSPRIQFHTLFGFDPSTSPDELTGTIPQALFMMNSGFVNGLIRASGQTRLHQILENFRKDDDALQELFLVVHAREPSLKELQVCRDYIRQVNNRQEAFEDILWSLLNSTEFQTKR